jgi:DNA-binding NarL/FixJ family response regulator/signal transduction histidine kinase
MYRRLLAILVVGLDTALMLAGHPDGVPPWAALAYLAVAVLVMALTGRPVVALGVALLLGSVTGSGHVLLLWAAYHAGRQARTRSRLAMVVGAASGGLAAQLAVAALAVAPRGGLADGVQRVAAIYVVFVALPLLAGRYVAQHERLVAVLRERNRELRSQRHLVAEQERLRERLRIARDMHDSLGQRLSLVSVQAAALEVSDLPPAQRLAVGQLAQAARGAMTELHELVGALRREPEPGSLGVGDISTVVGEFRAAGVPVMLTEHGDRRPITGSGADAAYRVVQEGLTNASRHAAGQPVTVGVRWETDTLVVTVTNPIAGPGPAVPVSAGPVVAGPVAVGPLAAAHVAAAPVVAGHGVAGDSVAEHGVAGQSVAGHGVADHSVAGHGLTGLAERVELVGGYLEHRSGDGSFRLVAMLPTLTEQLVELDEPARRGRTLVLGIATAVLMFVVLGAAGRAAAGCPMIRVLVADDEPLIRTGIRTVLESAGDIEVVGEAEDGRAAVDQAIRFRADVALLDINMPALDGLAALEELGRRAPALRTVVLTSFGTEPNVLRALQHAAAGFLLKSASPDELIRAVRSAHAGAAYLSPEVTRLLLGLVTPGQVRQRREAAERLARLTGRESDVLRLVAEGLANAEIAQRLRMSEPTIKTYVSRILTKLDCANRVQVALLLRDAGR